MTRKRKHGGRREGAGRPPKFGETMRQVNVRLPPSVKKELERRYGSVQGAVEALLILPHLKEDE